LASWEKVYGSSRSQINIFKSWLKCRRLFIWWLQEKKPVVDT
jgi:hypothetical protein